jgi:hypothetical protein
MYRRSGNCLIRSGLCSAAKFPRNARDVKTSLGFVLIDVFIDLNNINHIRRSSIDLEQAQRAASDG